MNICTRSRRVFWMFGNSCVHTQHHIREHRSEGVQDLLHGAKHSVRSPLRNDVLMFGRSSNIHFRTRRQLHRPLLQQWHHRGEGVLWKRIQKRLCCLQFISYVLIICNCFEYLSTHNIINKYSLSVGLILFSGKTIIFIKFIFNFTLV